jgi:hypothetical protein
MIINNFDKTFINIDSWNGLKEGTYQKANS